jgi:hypothetical protein
MDAIYLTNVFAALTPADQLLLVGNLGKRLFAEHVFGSSTDYLEDYPGVRVFVRGPFGPTIKRLCKNESQVLDLAHKYNGFLHAHKKNLCGYASFAVPGCPKLSARIYESMIKDGLIPSPVCVGDVPAYVLSTVGHLNLVSQLDQKDTAQLDLLFSKCAVGAMIHGESISTLSTMRRYPWWSISTNVWRTLADEGKVWLSQYSGGPAGGFTWKHPISICSYNKNDLAIQRFESLFVGYCVNTYAAICMFNITMLHQMVMHKMLDSSRWVGHNDFKGVTS